MQCRQTVQYTAVECSTSQYTILVWHVSHIGDRLFAWLEALTITGIKKWKWEVRIWSLELYILMHLFKCKKIFSLCLFFTDGSFYLRRENAREKTIPVIKPLFFIVEWKLKSPCIGKGVKKLGKLFDSTYPIRKLPLQNEMWFSQYFIENLCV